MRPGSPLRRALAALLLVTFPAIGASMALAGPAQSAPAAHAHTPHHTGCDGPEHPAGHRECCDFCGAACGCSVHFGAPDIQAPAPVVTTSAPPPLTPVARPAARVRHLLPLALGPPSRLA